MRKTGKKNVRSYEQPDDQPLAITPYEYGGLQEAYDHFNKELFSGALPDVFITYQRHAHSAGYFSPDRFSGRIGKFGKHELALNPDGFIDRTDKQITSTLVHEQAHVWQKASGKPSPRGYHNREWAAKMKSIGLQPSSTGMVGGRETGQRMSRYIMPSGLFEKAYQNLAATGWQLNLQSTPHAGPQGGRNSKSKFTCTACGQNTWGKPDLDLTCRACLLQVCQAAQEAGQSLVLIPDNVGNIILTGFDQKLFAGKKPMTSAGLKPLLCVDRTDEQSIKLMPAAA